MYLSKLVLNPRDRQARHDLESPYELHRTLWRAFPEEAPGRVLFRVDADRPTAPPVVLVQSDEAPAWARLAERGPTYLVCPPECKEFRPTFTAGQRLCFRLRANPTRKHGSTSKSERLAGAKGNGQRLALLHEAEQVAWLLRKGEQGGFRIPGTWLDGADGEPTPSFRVTVIPEDWVRCGKAGHGAARFLAVRFEGILLVTDPERFLATVADGIGSAKGFGFGLLSLARAED